MRKRARFRIVFAENHRTLQFSGPMQGGGRRDGKSVVYHGVCVGMCVTRQCTNLSLSLSLFTISYFTGGTKRYPRNPPAPAQLHPDDLDFVTLLQHRRETHRATAQGLQRNHQPLLRQDFAR